MYTHSPWLEQTKLNTKPELLSENKLKSDNIKPEITEVYKRHNKIDWNYLGY